MKALFLDRDGTLIHNIPYLSDPDKVEPVPGVAQALQKAKDLGYLLFLFTNQSGIGRGYYTLQEAEACNTKLIELLGLGENIFTAICIAPEAPEDPQIYRKPSPKFILEMIEHYKLSPKECIIVGDRLADVQAGVNAGIASVYLNTGNCSEAHEEAEALKLGASIFPSFAAFVQNLG